MVINAGPISICGFWNIFTLHGGASIVIPVVSILIVVSSKAVALMLTSLTLADIDRSEI